MKVIKSDNGQKNRKGWAAKSRRIKGIKKNVSNKESRKESVSRIKSET